MEQSINKVNEYINELDNEFKRVLSSGVFIYEKNWMGLINIINMIKEDNIAFSLKTFDYYDISNYDNLTILMEQLSLYERTKPERVFITKYKKWEYANIASQERGNIYQMIRKHQFINTEFTCDFFSSSNGVDIELKLFVNKEFNTIFLRMFGFNI